MPVTWAPPYLTTISLAMAAGPTAASPGARYVVAIDLGTSGTAFAYHAIPAATAAGARPTLAAVDTRLTVYAPGRRVKENEGKAPTAVCLDLRNNMALESVGTDAFDDWTRAEEEGNADS